MGWRDDAPCGGMTPLRSPSSSTTWRPKVHIWYHNFHPPASIYNRVVVVVVYLKMGQQLSESILVGKLFHMWILNMILMMWKINPNWCCGKCPSALRSPMQWRDPCWEVERYRQGNPAAAAVHTSSLKRLFNHQPGFLHSIQRQTKSPPIVSPTSGPDF